MNIEEKLSDVRIAEPDRMFGLGLAEANWDSQARAEALLPLALAQLGTAGTDRTEWVKLLVLRIVREVLPIALKAARLSEDLIAACEQAEDLEQAHNAAYAASEAGDYDNAAYAAEVAAKAAFHANAVSAASIFAAAFAAADAAEHAHYAAYEASNSVDVLPLAARIAVECIEETR